MELVKMPGIRNEAGGAPDPGEYSRARALAARLSIFMIAFLLIIIAIRGWR
jgi:hypothetical protein